MTSNSEAQQAGLERADVRQKVLQAVGCLPERQRRLLLLRELEGLSYAQIGEAMGISPSKVGKLLHRARLRFRQAYSRQIAGRETKEKCRRLGHLLSVLHDGELLAPEQRQVVEHLAECPDCGRVQQKLASTSELLATLVPTPAPPGLADRILARTATSGISFAAGGGTIWKLPIMLLAGVGFIGAVVAVVVFLWQDSDSSGSMVLPLVSSPTPTPTPTATARPSPTTSPSGPPVLTPAVTPIPEETLTPTPSPTATASPTPTPTPIPTPTPVATPTPSPTPSPIPSPTPPPTPVPGPGGIQGMVTCQGQAISGAQVTVSGPFPQTGQTWSGQTGGNGSFSTGLTLDAGSYIVDVYVVDVTDRRPSYASMPVSVPADGYASLSAQCTALFPGSH